MVNLIFNMLITNIALLIIFIYIFIYIYILYHFIKMIYVVLSLKSFTCKEKYINEIKNRISIINGL